MKRLGNILWKGWTTFGHAVGWFNSRLILGVLYLVVFASFGLGVRLFGRDPLRLKWKPGLKKKPETYYMEKEPVRQDAEGARHLF